MNSVERHSIVTETSVSSSLRRSLPSAAGTASADWNSKRAALLGHASSERSVISLILPHYFASVRWQQMTRGGVASTYGLEERFDQLPPGRLRETSNEDRRVLPIPISQQELRLLPHLFIG